jgi:Uma2 family endonuclease
MSTAPTTTVSLLPAALPFDWTLADVRRHVGGVPLRRIRLFPSPGTATEEDAFELHRTQGRLCELVDGILVEKAMGMFESVLTLFLAQQLNNFLDKSDLGILAGPDGPFRLFAGRMRMPDLSFVRWARLPGRRLPSATVLDMGPDLAIEVISKGNTKAEMLKKLEEYFRAGAKLVWYVYPEERRVVVYTSTIHATELSEHDMLDGGDVLPGFRLKLKKLFDRVRKEQEDR